MGIDLDGYYRLIDETKAITFLDIDLLRQRSPDVLDNSILACISMDEQDPYAAISLAQIRDRWPRQFRSCRKRKS